MFRQNQPQYMGSPSSLPPSLPFWPTQYLARVLCGVWDEIFCRTVTRGIDDEDSNTPPPPRTVGLVQGRYHTGYNPLAKTNLFLRMVRAGSHDQDING